jgi:hypothetical protein
LAAEVLLAAVVGAAEDLGAVVQVVAGKILVLVLSIES